MIHYQEQAYCFQFWPPQGSSEPFDTIHGMSDDQVRDHPWLSSVYYHWWRFLRESDAYKDVCDEAFIGNAVNGIYQDFGDLWESDDFWKWWLTCGCELFCEPRSYSPHTVDWGNVDEMLKASQSGQRILVSLSLEGDIDRTRQEIVDLLKRLKGTQPRRTRNESHALFQPLGDPKPLALDKYYRVWRCHKDNPEMHYADIAFKCGLKAKEVVDPADRIDVGNDVRRMIAKAKLIIEHIHQGVFPVLDKKAVERIPAHLTVQRDQSKLRRRERESGKYTNPVLSYGDGVGPICIMQGS